MGQIGVDAEVSLQHGRDRRVAQRGDRGDADIDRPVHVVLQDEGFGDDHSGKQDQPLSGPPRIISANARPRPGSQGVIGRPL